METTEEWIELYNSNQIDVDLSGWQLQDRAGTITTYSVPPVTKIMANGYLVFKRPDTKIILNNEGDGINLLSPSGEIKDSSVFTNAPLGQSYNKNLSGWLWSAILTPGTKNTISAPATKTSTKTAPASGLDDLSKTAKSVNNNIETASLADSLNLNENQSLNGQNPWFLFFTVLGIAIILSIVVLLIKFKLK